MAVRPGAGLLDGRFAGGQAVAEDGDYRPGGGAVPVRYGHRTALPRREPSPGQRARPPAGAGGRTRSTQRVAIAPEGTPGL